MGVRSTQTGSRAAHAMQPTDTRDRASGGLRAFCDPCAQSLGELRFEAYLQAGLLGEGLQGGDALYVD